MIKKNWLKWRYFFFYLLVEMQFFNILFRMLDIWAFNFGGFVFKKGTIQKCNPSDAQGDRKSAMRQAGWSGRMRNNGDNTLKWESWFALSDNRSRILSVRDAHSPYTRVKERIVNHRMRPTVRNTGLSSIYNTFPPFFFFFSSFFYQKENLKQFVRVVLLFMSIYPHLHFYSNTFLVYMLFIRKLQNKTMFSLFLRGREDFTGVVLVEKLFLVIHVIRKFWLNWI